MRNLFERVIEAQAGRLAQQAQADNSALALITQDDITAALRKMSTL